MYYLAKSLRWFLPAAYFLLILLGSCQKEHSLENLNLPVIPVDPNAKLSLVPLNNNCTDAQVTGSYNVSTKMDSSDHVQLSVHVSKPGNWTYNSGLINGFGFTGSGNFSDTGIQTILLQANGLPLETGNIIFPLKIGASNCQFTVNVTDEIADDDTIFYYKATINGKDYDQNVTSANGYVLTYGVYSPTLLDPNNVTYAGGIDYFKPQAQVGHTAINIRKGILHNYLTSTKTDFKNFFTAADIPYGTSDSGVSGIQITWTDENGKIWDTSAGAADQTSSDCKILSSKDYYDSNGHYYLRVKMKFTCKLYTFTSSEDAEVLTVTNGEFFGLFGMD